MKRYLIFAAVGPLLGGFWLLLTTTLMSGYWSKPPNAAEITKLLTVFDVYDTQADAISSFAGTGAAAAVAGKN